MNISEILSDDAILTELGERIARARIDRELTQAQLAVQAGVSKRTLERIEAGASAQMSSFIRILRVLTLLPRLEQVFPETGPGPMELLRHKGKARRRASTRGHSTGAVKSRVVKHGSEKAGSEIAESAKAWSWNDDGDNDREDEQ